MLHSRVVETSNASLPSQEKLSLAEQIAWTALIVATLGICYFSHLGAIGLVGPDEPRYAWIARDMAETGDWVTPRLYGKPWFEKPVLYYWEAGLCFKWFGVSETAARLPSALSALLATLALAWLALRWYGAETARWLLLLLPTSVGMIGFSHAAATDMPFSGMLTIAMVCAAVMLGLTKNEHTPILPRTPWVALLLFGFFLGLAVLTKGPAAIILSGGAIFFWALVTRRWRDALRLIHPTAIAAFCATALPWYVACARRNPDFFQVFIIEHNFKRYLTPEFQHIQPFWFYVPVLVVSFLPWAGLLVWSVVADGKRAVSKIQITPTTILLCTWSLFALVFFSLSKSKLPGYILPAIPAVALLLARSLVKLLAKPKKSAGALFILFALLFFFLAGFATQLFPHARLSSPESRLLVSFVVGMFAMTNALLGLGFLWSDRWNQSRLSLWQVAPICVVPLLFSFLAAERLPGELTATSAKTLAMQLMAQHIPTERTAVAGMMGRSFHYGLNFYLHREVPEWAANSQQEVYALSKLSSCADWSAPGMDCAEVPLIGGYTGWFLYRVKPARSTNGAHAGGQAQ
jgi:4-amino-4-deoxy-L-arabinose transferase-like glycosyltransferase